MKEIKKHGKVISLEEMRILQMEILDYVHDFCITNSIKYSLSGGTLIGAIRHRGFIPWDDDIDIQLLREDYNKLIDKWNQCSHPFVFYNIETGNGCFAYGKISNPNTVLKDGNRWLMGVNIDVYPIDKVVDMIDFNTRHEKILKKYKYLGRITRPYRWDLKTIFWKMIALVKNEKKVLNEINDIAVSKNDIVSNIVFEMVAGRGYKRPCPLSAYDETIEVPFENRKYMVIKGFDDYLCSCFDDYMSLPPIEKRVSHHTTEAYWKTE